MPDPIELHKSVEEAEHRIRPYVRQTYLQSSHAFSETTGANVYFKCENLQHTGSFKVRGAANCLLSESQEKLKDRGVVTASTGNHGRAVSFIAKQLGCQATIFAPENCDAAKVDAIKRNGSSVQLVGHDCVEAEASARAFAEVQRAFYVSPYNDLNVIAGQGTIGSELCRQLARIDAVFVSVGGGGMVSGIAALAKSRMPDCEIVGCSPENSNVMMQSVEAGHLLDLPSQDTLSDGTAGGVERDSITFEFCQSLVDRWISVSENEIRDALCQFIDREGMLIEGAAAVALAALVNNAEQFQGKNVVVVLCGGNISSSALGSNLNW